MALQGILEQRQPVGVQLIVQNDGVVQGLLSKPRVLVGEPRLLGCVALDRGEQLGARRQIDAAAVGRFEPRDRVAEKHREALRVGPAIGRHFRPLRLVTRPEELFAAAVADEGRERLIERGLSGNVERRVQQFVDDRFDQPFAIVAQQGAEQWVVEPPERTERHGGPDVGVVALRLELSGERFLDVDGALTASGATLDLIELVEQAGPYGMGNPAPVFVLPAHRVVYADSAGSDHVRLTLAASDGTRIKAVAFRALGTELGELLLTERQHPLHIAGRLVVDDWGRARVPSIHVEDVARVA